MPLYTYADDPEAFCALLRDERNKKFPQFPDTSGPTLAQVLASRQSLSKRKTTTKWMKASNAEARAKAVEELEKPMAIRKPHKEADPIPAGVPIVHWYRCYNSADSAIYNRARKDKTVNAAARKSGETRLWAYQEVDRRVANGVFEVGDDYIGRDPVEEDDEDEVEDEDDDEE